MTNRNWGKGNVFLIKETKESRGERNEKKISKLYGSYLIKAGSNQTAD